MGGVATCRPLQPQVYLQVGIPREGLDWGSVSSAWVRVHMSTG